MNSLFKGFAAAAVLVAAFSLSARAEDAPATTQAPAPTQASPNQASPNQASPNQASPTQDAPSQAKPSPDVVSRPALVPKPTDATTDATTEPAPHHHRRYARHYDRHYVYWDPFPIFLPHFYRNHIVWNRISWFHF